MNFDDDAGMGDAGPVPSGWIDRHDCLSACRTQAERHPTDTDSTDPTTRRSGANTIMNYYMHQLNHRQKAHEYQRQAEAQRLHGELRRSEARSARSALRRLARVASLFL